MGGKRKRGQNFTTTRKAKNNGSSSASVASVSSTCASVKSPSSSVVISGTSDGNHEQDVRNPQELANFGKLFVSIHAVIGQCADIPELRSVIHHAERLYQGLAILQRDYILEGNHVRNRP